MQALHFSGLLRCHACARAPGQHLEVDSTHGKLPGTHATEVDAADPASHFEIVLRAATVKLKW